MNLATGQRVVAVTGGGGGIGAAIAEELGRQGALVVTLDPLVSLDGSEALAPTEETTAGRIVAAGGAARATSVSVTDAEAVRALFAELGRLDAVVNVAGISRPTSFAKGSEDDWRAVLSVHLDGYVNVLSAALPIMAAAGHGRILGVTSGSGWRPADAGAYGCAKRAVASLTWQLGRLAPPGVVINAMSPIAVTRMVTAALGRAPAAGKQGSAATGGLSLGSMPAPEDLGPFGAHLVGEGFDACRGQVVFAGGSEVAVVEGPRLLEVVRNDTASLPLLLEAVTAGAFGPAEAQQATTGGSNPRFPSIYDPAGAGDLPAPAVRSCVVAADDADVRASLTAALERRGVSCEVVPASDGTFAGAAACLRAAAGEPEAVIVAPRGSRSATASGWQGALEEHAGLVDHIHADAGWARAVADRAAADGRPLRLVSLVDAVTTGGRSRAQAAAQLARSGRRATGDLVTPFVVSVETSLSDPAVAELAAHLVATEDGAGLAGAELVAGPGWYGLRSHPRARGSLTFGGPALPAWFDDALADVAGGGAS